MIHFPALDSHHTRERCVWDTSISCDLPSHWQIHVRFGVLSVRPRFEVGCDLCPKSTYSSIPMNTSGASFTIVNMHHLLDCNATDAIK